MQETLQLIQSVGPATLYLIGIIALFRLYRDSNESSRKEIIDLLKQYHEGMAAQTKAYEDLADRL